MLTRLKISKYAIEQCRYNNVNLARLRGDMVEVLKVTKHKYDYKVAPELIYNINKVTRANDLDCQKIEVIMILGNIRSLIELLIFRTACLML